MAGFDGSPTPEEIPVRAFSTVRRGLDPHEVRTFLEVLARDKRAQQARLGELLRAAYQALVDEPVPVRITALVERLEREEGGA